MYSVKVVELIFVSSAALLDHQLYVMEIIIIAKIVNSLLNMMIQMKNKMINAQNA